MEYCVIRPRGCRACDAPRYSGKIRGVAFIREEYEFIDYEDRAEWAAFIKDKIIHIVGQTRGGYAQTVQTVEGWGNIGDIFLNYVHTLTVREKFDCGNGGFWEDMEGAQGFRVLFLTDAGVQDSRAVVHIGAIAPVNEGIDTSLEYEITITWISNALPLCKPAPSGVFVDCASLERLLARLCPLPPPICADDFALFRFVVDGVTFPFAVSGQEIYVTAYNPACPIPLATASFNSWYYQPLIIGDVHFTLADAIADYSLFLGLLAPGSYATLDGNVVSAYINRDGWRFSRRGFPNPDVCLADFGFCAFNSQGFDPPTFDFRIINRIDCCDDDPCKENCDEPIYYDDPANGTYMSVLLGAPAYLMDVTNSVPYQPVTLDVGESVDLQAFLPGTPFDCCGPEDPYIFLEIGATTVPRNGTYTTPAGIKFELDETFLTITNNLVAPAGGSVNFLVRFSTCGASPILGLFTINYSDDVYCPFTFGTITKTPAGAITSNGSGAFNYDSIFGGGNCGIGTLAFTRTGGAVPPCCTGGEAVSIDVYEDGVNIGTLTGAAGTVLTPTVLTPKAILFTLVSTGTGGFVVQAEQNVCGLPAVTGQWGLVYTFVLCGQTRGETVILNSVPVAATPPCVVGGYSFPFGITNLSPGLTIRSQQLFIAGMQTPGFDEEIVIMLEWDDELNQTPSFNVVNFDIGSAPVCCNAYIAPQIVSYGTVTYGPGVMIPLDQTPDGTPYAIDNGSQATTNIYGYDGRIAIPYVYSKTTVSNQNVLINLDRGGFAPETFRQQLIFDIYFCNQVKRLRVFVCNKTRQGKWGLSGYFLNSQTISNGVERIRPVVQTRKISGCNTFNETLFDEPSGIDYLCDINTGYTVFTLTGYLGINYPAQSVTINDGDAPTFPTWPLYGFPTSPNGKLILSLRLPSGYADFDGAVDVEWSYSENISFLIADGNPIALILTMERHDCGDVITRNFVIRIYNGFPQQIILPMDGVPPN